MQIRFDDGLGDKLAMAAKQSGQPVGSFVRQALWEVLDQPSEPLKGHFGYKGPKSPHALQAYLAHDFAYASDWEDLQSTLAAKGYELAERGGGLVLQTLEGERLCKACEIGQPYSQLMQRFGASFPGHSHTHLEKRYLQQTVLKL